MPSTTDGRALAGTSFGSYLGTTTNGQVPNITGGTGGCVGNVAPYGVFYQGGQYGTAGGGSGKFYQNVFDASRSSSLYTNNATQVRAASLFIAFLIKY